MDKPQSTSYYEPRKCPTCKELMKFKGLGEYVCEQCGYCELDDYGKVRNYIETHRGANAMEIERETGVSQKAIRYMLRDERIEVSRESKVFIKCERCGKDIVSGHYCPQCRELVQKLLDDKPERKTNSKMHGYAKSNTMNEGEIRFRRNK